MHSHLGELAALATAACWTITALAFESATRRIGSVAVNAFKLTAGFLFLAAFNLLLRGQILPLDAPAHAWLWLSLSGIVGFVIGDYLLFKSYTIISARISMLIMALAPPMAVLLGWVFLGERLSPKDFYGIGLTLAGIAMVVLRKSGQRAQLELKHPLPGILLALGGAAGQAGGLVLSKYGMGDFNAFGATQIRVLAGMAGFLVLFTFLGRWKGLNRIFGDRPLLGTMALGSAFGPFLGVSFSLLAVQHTNTGVAATIMAIVPVLIIPPSVIIFRQKVTWLESAGAVVAVGGVALLFIK